jgi:hypothetical protein
VKVFKIVSAILFLCVIAYTQVTVNDTRLSPRLLNYQGYLTDDEGIPVTDPALSMTFSIYDALTSGNLKWTETQSSVDVDKGVFSVILGSGTPIPDSVFVGGTDCWLELTVDGQTLSPRTRITSVGYAYTSTYSDTAEYARNAAADNDWSFLISDGADTTLQMNGRWGLARYGNMLYGNADSTHVCFGVACTTGTNGQNFMYSAVSGGYGNAAGGSYAYIGGGEGNSATDAYATIVGGNNNEATIFYATVCGGLMNQAKGMNSFIGSGINNWTDGDFSVIGGGSGNVAFGPEAVVGGGFENRANGGTAVIVGGSRNVVDGDHSAILGGYADTIAVTADHSYLFGINSNLTQAMTFMVDMPHIRFGTEAAGYEFPAQDGSADQVMVTDGSGMVSWSTVPGDADWVISGSDMYSGVSGNVGIGTTSPAMKLDVNGDIGADDIIVDNVVCEHMSANNDISTPADVIVGGGLEVGADGFIDGNLGVGTSSPSSKVHITGMGANCALQINGSSSSSYFYNDANGLHIKSYDGSNQRQIQFHTGSDWTPEMVILSSGNVGIGTASPAVELDVDGTIDADDIVCTHMTAIDDIATASDAYVGGTLNVDMDGIFDGFISATSGMTTTTLDVNGFTGYDQVRMRTSYTPTGTSDPHGGTGDIAWDDDYVYIKTNAGWKRAQLGTW